MSEELNNEEEIKIEDKRRFNAEGDKVKVEVEEAKIPVKSAEVIKLETDLKAEKERREAAEIKLVEVQKRFDEAKVTLEKETQEMRQRLMKTLEDRAKQNQSNFISTLLPVLDNLNLAIDHAEKDSSLENLIGGVKGTARSFENALREVGVEAVPSVGMNFDPLIHEAIDMVQVDGEQDGKITAEYQRGYKFGEKLLRPSKVQVGKG
ncbi:MAG TPA: nucleotide exchange factor GrpE [Pyrinomonadaceae bacterium]|nr:nucleotide exchange factor GrpE [Pyrinomonadaceae bacterium]